MLLPFFDDVKSNPGTAPFGESAVQINLGCRANKCPPCVHTLGQPLCAFHILFFSLSLTPFFFFFFLEFNTSAMATFTTCRVPEGNSIEMTQAITQTQGKG